MKLLKLALLWALLAPIARADTATCFTFAASPDTYSAPPGGVFTVYTTYTNCGSEGYVVIGDSFGSDASPYVILLLLGRL
jgi:predicted permease